METKVKKKGKLTNTIDNVYVDISDTEKKSTAIFFGLRGMKKAFLDRFENHERRHLDTAITGGTYKVSLLKDVRQFIEDHKEEVAEFLHGDTVAA